MNNVFGITGIRVKAFYVEQNGTSEVNEFLAEHDGEIIDIQIIPLFQGASRWVIIFHETEREVEA